MKKKAKKNEAPRGKRGKAGTKKPAKAKGGGAKPPEVAAPPVVAGSPAPKHGRSRKAKGRDPRLPAAGTVLTRTYKDKRHEVTVLEDGFEYDGKSYGSLSRIAGEITGGSVNGYLFFGLIARPEKPKKAAEQ